MRQRAVESRRGGSLVSDSSPDLSAFRSFASSAASATPFREGGEVVEQTTVFKMAAVCLRRMEARATSRDGPEVTWT